MDNNIHVLLSSELNDFFENQNAKTKTISWADDFSEGPLTQNFGSDEFWMKRYAFTEDKYKIEHLQYFDDNIKPIVSLQNLEGVKEVILWNCNTLTSQVNLVAIGSYLRDCYRKDVKFTLVNIKAQNLENNNPFNFNEQKDIAGINISRNNLLFLHKCWLNLLKNAAENIEINNLEHAKFPFLKMQVLKYFEKH